MVLLLEGIQNWECFSPKPGKSCLGPRLAWLRKLLQLRLLQLFPSLPAPVSLPQGRWGVQKQLQT